MGIIFRIPGTLTYVLCGIWGALLCIGIVADHFGSLVAGLALLIAPATLVLVPFYEGFANGNWYLLLLVYGGGITAALLNIIGGKIDGERQ